VLFTYIFSVETVHSMSCKQLFRNVREAWLDLEQAIAQIQQLEELVIRERVQLQDERAKLQNEREELKNDRSTLEAEKAAMMNLRAHCDDLIGLNFRGEQTITVKRSLLFQIEGSTMATMFSGCYEDQLILDKAGNVFLDFPSSVMLPLIDWLTACHGLPPGTRRPTIAIAAGCEDLWCTVVKFFGLESIVQSPPVMFSGIKANFKVSELHGWNIAFCKPYSHKTSLEDFQLPDVAEDSAVLVGARRASTDEMIVAAIGRLDVIVNHKMKHVTQPHNGVHWYCTPGRSIGFTPQEKVRMNYADTYDQCCPLRLSWLLDGAHGGWRAGSRTLLHDSHDVEKVIMTPVQTMRIDV